MKWLRSIIVNAAPYCTLWVEDINLDILRFRFNRRWIITATEYMELYRGKMK